MKISGHFVILQTTIKSKDLHSGFLTHQHFWSNFKNSQSYDRFTDFTKKRGNYLSTLLKGDAHDFLEEKFTIFGNRKPQSVAGLDPILFHQQRASLYNNILEDSCLRRELSGEEIVALDG